MDGLVRVGRLLFAAAMAFFGVQCIIFARGGTGLVPGPPWTVREWVTTEEGRTARVGTEIDCKRCDEERI